MLSLSKPLKGIGQGNYYLNRTQEDYYLDGGEPLGHWHGNGARILGLSGVVTKEEFMNVLGGFSPDGKAALTQNSGKDSRRSAWDLTFNAPKSVSVLWSQSTPAVRKIIQSVHNQAVGKALDSLEEVAGVTRRGKGGAQRESTPFTAALFEHGTSRALEPHLHTHSVLMNISLRRDGTTGSLESLAIFVEKIGAGEGYRKHLAEGLVRSLGVAVEWKDGLFEVKGVPKHVCDHFSTRRKEIEKALSERGLNSPQAARVAALDTRGRKEDVPREKLFASWQAIGAKLDFGPEQAARLIAERPREQQAERKERTEKPEAGKDADKTHRQQPHARPWFTKKARSKTQRPFQKAPGARYGKILKTARVAGIEVRLQQKYLFPKAPKWSPASKISIPAVNVNPPKKAEVISEVRSLGGTIALEKKHLFPKAPAWSPASKLTAPALRVKPHAWGKEVYKRMTQRTPWSEFEATKSQSHGQSQSPSR